MHCFALLLLITASGLSWSQTVLVPAGSTWKYLDNGSDQGVAWRAAAFDDSKPAYGSQHHSAIDARWHRTANQAQQPDNDYPHKQPRKSRVDSSGFGVYELALTQAWTNCNAVYFEATLGLASAVHFSRLAEEWCSGHVVFAGYGLGQLPNLG